MPAIRLSFDVINGKLKLRKGQKLNMRVPPERHPDRVQKGAGLWAELRDSKGKPLYQYALATQILANDVEIRTGDSDKPLVRRPGKNSNTIFTVVIPDDKTAVTFHILERRQGVKKAEPNELAKVNLAKIEYQEEH